MRMTDRGGCSSGIAKEVKIAIVEAMLKKHRQRVIEMAFERASQLAVVRLRNVMGSSIAC